MPKKTSFIDLLRIFLQYVFARHVFSLLVAYLSHNENETLKNLMIKRFGKRYKINTKEAISRNLNNYPSFNSFFTRQLKPDARPIIQLKNGIACPADGTIIRSGSIKDGELILAKGKQFTIDALLGGDILHVGQFKEGSFTTIYLSPRDYHRIHMPLDGTLRETVHIPGRLFNVNPKILNLVSNVYAKNERVVSFFDTEAGPMAIIMVGAILSSSIETVWDGVITPPSHSEIRHWNHPYNPPSAKKGEEMGLFNMGSTVILLFSKNRVCWESSLVAGKTVKMGELIGKIAQ